MESMNSSSGESQATVHDHPDERPSFSDQWLNEQFENLLPRIQEQWPDLAKQTLEATKGSLDDLVRVISLHSGNSNYGVKEQLEEIFETAGDKTKDFAKSLEPLEKQLEELLDELNTTLRPRIEKPVREKPIMAIGIAAGIGIIIGLLIKGGREK